MNEILRHDVDMNVNLGRIYSYRNCWWINDLRSRTTSLAAVDYFSLSIELICKLLTGEGGNPPPPTKAEQLHYVKKGEFNRKTDWLIVWKSEKDSISHESFFFLFQNGSWVISYFIFLGNRVLQNASAQDSLDPSVETAIMFSFTVVHMTRDTTALIAG